jgi:hypothetical protein
MLTIIWPKMALTLSRVFRLNFVDLLRREVLETHQLRDTISGKL